MPYSLVINLTPVAPLSPKYLSGRHLHALFLSVVSSINSDLGSYFHQSQADKAFTISPLQISGKSDEIYWNHTKPIPSGVSCWFRISLLDDTLFGELTPLWLNLNPEQPWHLGKADLHITSILGTPQSTQPWANSCSYQQLYDQSSKTEGNFPLTFFTPTAFRNGKYDTALPTPGSVFNSLLKRWNKYSKIPFEGLDFSAVFPSFFDIYTEIVADSRSKFIGCVGTIHYRLLGEVDPLVIKQINTLANYALYCGVGRKTTMGMGMAMRVNSE
jgi:CRISPR-associated endoribonuclease Cas6